MGVRYFYIREIGIGRYKVYCDDDDSGMPYLVDVSKEVSKRIGCKFVRGSNYIRCSSAEWLEKRIGSEYSGVKVGML